jgi:hypothetical protein
MKKLIGMMLLFFWSQGASALSCDTASFESYIFGQHIVKARLVNQQDIEYNNMVVNQYFLVEPIVYLTASTQEKLVVKNMITKRSLVSRKASMNGDPHGMDNNYDIIIDTSKVYYVFVDKKNHMVETSPCNSRVIREDRLMNHPQAAKAIALFERRGDFSVRETAQLDDALWFFGTGDGNKENEVDDYEEVIVY